MLKKYIDTNYDEISNNNKLLHVNKQKYYSIGQVADRVNVPKSTIDYWTIAFNELLKVDKSNVQRRYTEKNIQFLIRVKKLLKEENYSIEQAKKLLAKEKIHYDNNNKDNENNDLNINAEHEKITIEDFLKILDDKLNSLKQSQQDSITQLEQNLQLEYTKNIIPKIEDVINKINIQIDSNIKQSDKKHNISIDLLNKNLKNYVSQLNSTLEKKENANKERDIQLSLLLKNILKEKQEENDKNQKMSFWFRIFHKNKE